MSEYIEREAAITAIKKDIMGGLNYESILKRISSVDVQPVKHGRWVQDAVYVDETTGEPCLAWFCNQCGEPQMVGTNYCPNCGAKMDGK